MRTTTTFAAAAAFASAVVASPYAKPSNGEQPYPFTLTQWQASDIVNAFKSVLEGVSYNGMSINQTAKKYVAADYTEISDSIGSLIGHGFPVCPVVLQPATIFK
jgi:hypothetical protein